MDIKKDLTQIRAMLHIAPKLQIQNTLSALLLGYQKNGRRLPKFDRAMLIIEEGYSVVSIPHTAETLPSLHFSESPQARVRSRLWKIDGMVLEDAYHKLPHQYRAKGEK